MNDLSSEARTLLDKAEGGDDPNLEDRQRVWRALGRGVAAGAAGAATARVAGASSKAALGAGSVAPVAVPVSKLTAWLALGLVGGLGTTGLALWVSGRTEPPAAVAPSHGPSEPSELPAVRGTAPLGDDSPRVLTEPAETAAAPPVEPRGESIAPPPLVPAGNRPAPTKPVAEPAPVTSLGAETSLLESARAALGRGDPRGALTLLEAHERAFPEGALVEERLASKVFALCGLGRTADARRVATEFLARAPGSPLRARVQESCAFRP